MGTRPRGPRKRAGIIALADRRPPPKVPVAGLTREQEIRLADHLLAKLDDSEAARLFYAVEHWFFYGPTSSTLEARKRSAAARRRYGEIAELARGLRETLSDPQWDETDRGLMEKLMRDVGIDPPSFGAALERVGRFAARFAEVRNAKRPRGAPPVEWRDALIALVRAHYPVDRIAVAQFSHFEDTIGLLLEFLGAELEDLHKQIVRTLKRAPPSPFVLQLEEPAAAEPRAHLPWSAEHRGT